MVLINRKSENQMFVLLVPIDRTTMIEESPTSFDLKNEFTAQHMLIKLFEDPQKRRALFVTQSYNEELQSSAEKNLIDSVTFMEIILGNDDKLNF